MRILHTADWHLGDRLGRIDRTDDLRRAVERVANYCREEMVDVMLVAGDLFSELAGPEGLRDAIRHLQMVFEDFLGRGGTILTLTGNHDKESFCQTLRHAMSLAAPFPDTPGALGQPGRLYLATGPTLMRLADPTGGKPVQFVLMPYPTPARYLTADSVQRYQSLEEKNRHMMAAYTDKLNELRCSPEFDAALPTVLGAHIAVRGAQLPTLFRLSEEEDVVFADTDLPTGFDYVALGHIHRPQSIGGHAHIRYAGSIERMDLGESNDDKGVVVFDIAPGRRVEPRVLPLETTPVYIVQIHTPRLEMSGLTERYPDCQKALVRIECTYRAGEDNREELLRELEHIFPRWYDRDFTEANALAGTLTTGEPVRSKSFEDTVRDYLKQELTNHADDLQSAVLARVEDLMREEHS
jgi:DNA repair protein SbcD/Mre11